MVDEQEYPDWESMSQLTAIRYRLFAAERWYESVQMMYNDIINDPNVDSDDLTSVFKGWCESNAMLKLMFTTWIEGFKEREDSPISHDEILQFVNFLALSEEQHVESLRKDGLSE